jgi:hypothetical protein
MASGIRLPTLTDYGTWLAAETYSAGVQATAVAASAASAAVGAITRLGKTLISPLYPKEETLKPVPFEDTPLYDPKYDEIDYPVFKELLSQVQAYKEKKEELAEATEFAELEESIRSQLYAAMIYPYPKGRLAIVKKCLDLVEGHPELDILNLSSRIKGKDGNPLLYIIHYYLDEIALFLLQKVTNKRVLKKAGVITRSKAYRDESEAFILSKLLPKNPDRLTIRQYRHRTKARVIAAGSMRPLKEEHPPCSAIEAIESTTYSSGDIPLEARIHTELEYLYTVPEMQPLMKLMAIYSMQRPKRFKIIITPSFDKLDPLKGDGCRGFYSHKHTAFIQTADRSEEGILSTVFHESAHFAMKRVFCNWCDPYASFRGEEAFKEIAQATKKRVDDRTISKDDPLNKQLWERFERVYTHYPTDLHDRELIVRVPQIISLVGKEIGCEWLRQNVPELFEYYLTVVNPAITAHLEKLDHLLDLDIGTTVPEPGALEAAEIERLGRSGILKSMTFAIENDRDDLLALFFQEPLKSKVTSRIASKLLRRLLKSNNLARASQILREFGDKIANETKGYILTELVELGLTDSVTFFCFLEGHNIPGINICEAARKAAFLGNIKLIDFFMETFQARFKPKYKQYLLSAKERHLKDQE